MFHTYGRKWKLIAENIGKYCTSITVKYCALLLATYKRVNEGFAASIPNLLHNWLNCVLADNEKHSTSFSINSLSLEGHISESINTMYILSLSL